MVSIAYEAGGRTAQKQRTRTALIDAARALVARGDSPTVEEAAEAASVSRATAYRYFPSQRDLLLAAHPEIDDFSLLPVDPPAEVAARLELAVERFTELVVDTEAQQRTMLRLSLEADDDDRRRLLLRQGRAIEWLKEALAPLRETVPEDELHRLVLGIRSAIGIEAFVWLVDVARLDRREATALMRWSARALLQAALAEAREH
jgi:AcrR family transcriptional regulator